MGGHTGELTVPPESYILTFREAPLIAKEDLGRIEGTRAENRPMKLEGRFESGSWYALFKCNYRYGQLHDFEWTKTNAWTEEEGIGEEGSDYFGFDVEDDNGKPFVKVILDSGFEHGTDTGMTFYAKEQVHEGAEGLSEDERRRLKNGEFEEDSD